MEDVSTREDIEEGGDAPRNNGLEEISVPNGPIVDFIGGSKEGAGVFRCDDDADESLDLC